MIILIENPKQTFLLDTADIFYQKQFFDLHFEDQKTYYLGFANNSPQNIIGSIQLSISDGYARSPVKGTYGGMYLQPNHFSIPIAEESLAQTEAWLLKKKVKHIELLLPSLEQKEDVHTWVNIFLRNGYTISAFDLNYTIPVNSNPFENIVNRACLKKLKKIALSTLSIRELSEPEWNVAVDLIIENRKRKGRCFSMNIESIIAMRKTFKNDFKIVGVFDEIHLRSAAIYLKINIDTIYVFAWGDDGILSHLTPTTLLAKWLYEYCQLHKFSKLDLGISSDNNMPNIGLVNYKKSLGARASLKLTVRKEF